MAIVFAGWGFVLAGIAFKLSLFPFHLWTPDVYEGAPAPIVGLMSTGPKAAAFAVLLRVMFEIDAPGRFWLLWVSAALSMTLGNLGALVALGVFAAKTAFFLWLFVWVRWTLPRYRYDQLMRLGWTVLLPLAFLNLAITVLVSRPGVQ